MQYRFDQHRTHRPDPLPMKFLCSFHSNFWFIRLNFIMQDSHIYIYLLVSAHFLSIDSLIHIKKVLLFFVVLSLYRLLERVDYFNLFKVFLEYKNKFLNVYIIVRIRNIFMHCKNFLSFLTFPWKFEQKYLKCCIFLI